MTKEVIIIAGANGSGKTTFARLFEEKYPFEFINADDIAKKINPNDIKSAKIKAGKIFLKKIHNLLNANENLIIESTLSGRTLLGLIEKIKNRSYSLKIIYIFLENPEMCIERISERVLKGGHPVPNTDVIRRFYRSKKNFWNLYKELADKWHLVYNSEQQFIELAIGKKGTYTIYYKKLFKEFIRDIKEETNGSR